MVIVNTTIEAVRNSPEFDESQAVTEMYEQSLHDHYGRNSS